MKCKVMPFSSILIHATHVLFCCRVSCMVAVNGISASAIVCLGYPLKVILCPDNTPANLTHLYFSSNSYCSVLVHVKCIPLFYIILNFPFFPKAGLVNDD